MGNKAAIGILIFFLSVSSCASQQPENDFYEGLKEQRGGAQAGAVAHFEKALHSTNAVIAAAAAAELMNLHYAGAELSDASMAGSRQVISNARDPAPDRIAGSWARAFDAIEAAGQGEAGRRKALALLLDGNDRLPDEAASYALQQWRGGYDGGSDSAVDDAADAPDNDNGFFTGVENAAINGRLAASRSRYAAALIFFRIVLRDSPDLFFRYPDLLTDLGRTFQYAPSGLEGRDLFLKWERDAAMFAAVQTGSENTVRYRLLFFAGRIARQRGEPNIELFERALPFAPENPAGQSDACIWYILDSALAQSPDTAIRYLETYISRWQDEAYFADVMGKLTRELVFRRRWDELLNVFTVLQNRPVAVKAHVAAQYAWIIGRALEEGLFSPATLPGKSLTAKESAKAYMRIAYNTDKAWYYRSLGAAALGEPFLALPKTPASPPSAKGKSAKDNDSDTLQFLLGFFEHNAAEFAIRYIRLMENDLSPEELRRLAGAMGAAGYYQESIRIVSRYAGQKGYQIQRRDLELLYPQPYKELVERYAKEAAIDPALLFGLIRTESAFNSDIVSHAGAVGLTQLMPATAREAAARIRRQGGPDYADSAGDSIEYLRDPAMNIHIGAAYLAYLNERMGDPLLALLAYNGGMNRVRRWRAPANIGSLPPDLFLETVEYPETRDYGRSVMAAAAMYRGLYYSWRGY